MLHLNNKNSRNILFKEPKTTLSILLALIVTASFSIPLTFGDTGHTWTITLDNVNGQTPPFTILTNPIHLEGTIASINFVGGTSQYQVQVEWGDGTIATNSTVQITQVGSDFTGTWSSNPDHNYTTTGKYTATVKLYHSQPPGAESSGDAVYAITLTVIVGVNVDTSPQGLPVIVDGTTYASPFQTNWQAGSQHFIATIPQQETEGTQYIWNSWSDGGTITHQITIQNKDCLYTANFDTKYYLTVASDPSTILVTPGQGWYDNFSIATLNAPVADGFLFSYWDIDGIRQGATNNPIGVQMDSPHAATAHYVPEVSPTSTPDPTSTPSPTQTPAPTSTPSPTETPTPSQTPTSTPTPTPTASSAPTPTPSPNPTTSPTPTATHTPTSTPKPSQVSVTFNQSGIGDDLKSSIIIIDGDSLNNTALPITFKWNQGSTHSFTFNSPLAVEGKRYSWTNTTGLTSLRNGTLVATTSGTITGYYGAHQLLTINAIGVKDPFIALVNISASPTVTINLSPTSSIQDWIRSGAQTTTSISAVNIIGHGDWAIFKTWTGQVEQDTNTISFSMTTATTINATFFKANPVAESISYSLIAGIAAIIILSLINGNKPAEKRKTLRALGTAAGITVISIIVAVVVSSGAAIGYGIEVNKLLDFTNWAVTFTGIEALVFLFASTLIVRKVQQRKKTSNKELFAGYDKVWQKGPEAKREY